MWKSAGLAHWNASRESILSLEQAPLHSQKTNPVKRLAPVGGMSSSGTKAPANEVFATLEKVIDRLCDIICTLTSDTIKSITGHSWIINCFN